MNTIKDLITENTDKFEKYYKLLTEWNEKMNLTSITDEYSVATKHFLDCLSVFDYVDIKDGDSIIDIGCGAGFPSAVMAIKNPSLKMTMLDSLNKRLIFLNTLTEELGLKNCTTVHARAEEYAKKKEYREKYDFAVSRAVANLASLAELSLGYVKVGGYFIAFKGPNADEEIKNANKAISCMGAKIVDVVNYSIKTTDLHHNLVIIKKIEKTPDIYPRKTPKPIKEPLM